MKTVVDHLQDQCHAHLGCVQLVSETEAAVVYQLVAPQFFKRLLEIS